MRGLGAAYNAPETASTRDIRSRTAHLATNTRIPHTFAPAAIDDAVKYLKIEASGKTLNSYTISKIA